MQALASAVLAHRVANPCWPWPTTEVLIRSWAPASAAAAISRPGQAREHVLQVGIEVIPGQARRLPRAHHRGRALARTLAAGEQVENLWPGNDARIKNAQTRGVSCKSTLPPSKGPRLSAASPAALVRQRRPNHQHLAVHFALAATAACCRRSEKLCPRMALCKNSAKYCRGKHFWSFSGGTDESCKFSQSGGECVAKERTLHRRRPCRAFFASAGALAAAGHKGLQICLQGCFRLDSYQLGKLGRGNILGALCTRLHTAGAASPPLPCAAYAAIAHLLATAQAHPLVVQNSGLSCKAGITDQGPGISPGSSADSCTKNAAMPARAWGFHAALPEQTHLLQRNAPVPLAFAVAARYGPLHPLADLGSNAQERGEQQQFSARNQESADICEKPEFSRIGMAIFDAQAP